MVKNPAMRHITAERVAELSQDIIWLVVPSLTLFVMLPFLLRAGWNFWLCLTVACVSTATAYFGVIWCLQKFSIRM